MSTIPSLYERLGEVSGISALVEDIVGAHVENATIGARFRPYAADAARFTELKGLLRDFLVAGSGGPTEYKGKDMITAHSGLNISNEEYMAAIDDIMMVLAKHQIDEQTQKDVLMISYGLKKDIVKL